MNRGKKMNITYKGIIEAVYEYVPSDKVDECLAKMGLSFEDYIDSCFLGVEKIPREMMQKVYEYMMSDKISPLTFVNAMLCLEDELSEFTLSGKVGKSLAKKFNDCLLDSQISDDTLRRVFRSKYLRLPIDDWCKYGVDIKDIHSYSVGNIFFTTDQVRDLVRKYFKAIIGWKVKTPDTIIYFQYWTDAKEHILTLVPGGDDLEKEKELERLYKFKLSVYSRYNDEIYGEGLELSRI